MLDKLKGYKTITSALVVAIVAVAKFFGAIDDATAKLLFELAAAAGLYGIYDRVKTEGAK